MAFFSNFCSETSSHSVLEEKGHGMDRIQSPLGTEDVGVPLSGKGFDMNMDVQEGSEGEPNEANKLQNEAATTDTVIHLKSSGRKSDVAGKWGSTFWKDCQPMQSHAGSDSGQDSDSRNVVGLEYISPHGREERLDSEDDNGSNDVDKGQHGHSSVPEDEMLSDEYYEQDGEDQSDVMRHRGFHHSLGSNSRPQQKATPGRASRVLSDTEDFGDGDDYDYNNDDADADYEEEDKDGNSFYTVF